MTGSGRSETVARKPAEGLLRLAWQPLEKTAVIYRLVTRCGPSAFAHPLSDQT